MCLKWRRQHRSSGLTTEENSGVGRIIHSNYKEDLTKTTLPEQRVLSCCGEEKFGALRAISRNKEMGLLLAARELELLLGRGLQELQYRKPEQEFCPQLN